MLHRLKSSVFAAMPGFVQRPWMARHFKKGADRAEPEVCELRKILRPSDVAIDVGGNIGLYTFAMSQLAARVITFEPNPQLARRLRALRLPNVEVREFALSSRNGSATLSIPDWPDGHGFGTLREDLVFENTRFLNQIVEMRTLDSFDFGRINFIKIDVEGFEEEVLAGAMRTLEKAKPAILVELVDYLNPGVHGRVCDMLAKLGYSGFFFLDKWHSMAEFSLEKYHDRSRVKKFGHLPRSQWGYVNNFLFLPAGMSIAE